jgi:hypothetical protein
MHLEVTEFFSLFQVLFFVGLGNPAKYFGVVFKHLEQSESFVLCQVFFVFTASASQGGERQGYIIG